ncbi:TPR repeat-containing protein, partial [Reticulomyxa filosa]
VKEDDQSAIKKENISKTLDFRKHWNKHWRRSNTEAAKTVEQMMHNKEKGLIIVALNKKVNDNLYSILALANDNKIKKKKFEDYCMYVIKRDVVVLKVAVDGNIYVVDCKLECDGLVNVTTQIFVTSKAIVDERLKQFIYFIPWNTKMHHDIPVQFQELEDNAEKCRKQGLFDESVFYSQKYLQIASDNFEFYHYTAIGYHLLGLIYDNKKEYEKEIECYENILTVRKKIFGNTNVCNANLHWNLGQTFKIIGKREISNKHFEEAWKIYSIVLGEWNKETLRAKRKMGMLPTKQ